MTKNNKPPIKKVNDLVKKAFGRFYSGNWNFVKGALSGEMSASKIDELNTVGIYVWFGLGEYYKGIARFTSKDGSEILTKKKYTSKAEKYAELYEKEFGKKVTINYKS